MADLKYTATLDDQISPKLKKIEDTAKKVTEKMSGLAGAIAGLAVGASINNAIRYADAIQDISNATSIAVQNIVGFTRAVENNGGNAETAQQSIYKLVTAIGAAAQGSKNAQLAFASVGVTLRDLETLSEAEILEKTIQGLAKIEDAGERAGVATEILGKNFRGIDARGVAGGLAQATASSLQYAKAVTAASDMQGKLDLAMQRFQLAVLKAIEPLVTFINKLSDDDIAQFIESVVKLGAVIVGLTASIYAIEKAIIGLNMLIVAGAAAFALFKVGVAGAAAGFVLLAKQASVLGLILKNLGMLLILPFTTLGGLLSRIAMVFASLTGVGKILLATFAAIGVGLAKMTPLIALASAAFFVLNEVVRKLTDTSIVGWMSKGIDKVKEFIGITSKVEENESKAETNRLARQNDFLKKEEQKAKKVREVQDAYDGQRKKLDEISQSFATQNRALVSNINFETTLIGKTEEQVELQRALNELQGRAAAEVEKLRTAKSNLAKDEQHLGKAYDEQIVKIQQQTSVDSTRLTSAITKLQQVNSQERARLDLIEATNRQLDQQAQIESKLRSSSIDLQRQIEDFNVESMTDEFEQGLEKINLSTNRRVGDLRKAFEEMINESNMDPASVQRYTEALIQLESQVKSLGLAEQQRYAQNNPQTFSAGWQKALEDYTKNVTDAANRGGLAFNSVMRNMNFAIDDFVETGKFNFKDFSRSIIQELIKIELKAAASKLFSSLFSGAGNFVAGMLGIANG